ncbi:MAG: MBG domain-containing protein [Cyclobacteriaceae bacterium]|nr:MBG domain-containing protein [Cyclobacteriaceae bacterium]
MYGEDDPILAYTTVGLVGEDEFTGALSRQPGENVGTYSINIGNLSPGINYTMTFVPANLTITKAALTVRADDKDYYIYYGGKNKYFQFDPLPVWTSTITGLTNGDTEQTVFSSAATYKIQQTIFTGPGTFSITPLPRSMYSPQNYNVTYVKGALYVKIQQDQRTHCCRGRRQGYLKGYECIG